MAEEQKKPASELRFDLVSKHWVVIATGRARRPETFARKKDHLDEKKDEANKKDCPFCNIETQLPPVLAYPKEIDISKEKDSWSLVVIPNKFPAFVQGDSLRERAEGPYSLMDGIGFHEVVVTKDHYSQMAEFPIPKFREVIDAYQERYLELMNEKLVNYISIFHNHGFEAGASIVHPHSQIIAMPVMDPDIKQSLDGSRLFFEMQGKCVHCTKLEWDREDGRRIIFENKKFVALCPFASRVAFEIRIYPKAHNAYFERIKDNEKDQLAEVFKTALGKVFKGLNKPSYNFFLHTGPCDGKNYDHYHWHFDIMPKTSTWAGFELGTGIEISTIEPERAAEYLRGIE